MRSDPAIFHSANIAPQKSPRFVVATIFDVASIYVTSHTGITTVPGVVLDGHLQDPSAISQRIVPDEGRSEIGSMSFTLIDKGSAFTAEARTKLNQGKGLRGKEVRLYVGDEGMDFTAFQRFQTQVIGDVEYDEGVYRIQCRDITREQRKEIFEPKKTTLRDSISATATTVPVYVTTGFSTVFHGPSYSDAPSSTVGYIIIDKEIIRYTGKTADSFTGCTRGVLNTRAVAHEVDAGTTADRRPKVEEYIYLELPAAKLAYALLTGVLHGDSATLPSHWHLGIATTWVRLSDFTGIGSDLWNAALDTAGFVARFTALKKTDGKRFLESELYMLLGCYSPIYSDGTIGLRRMNHVLADAPAVVELNDNNCVSWSGLKHEMDGLHNHIRVDWNWDGEDFTRRNEFVDAASVSTYGTAPIKELKFKGLHGARHTDAIVRKRIDALRDRYTWPPETMTVTVLPSLNRLEVGDIVRVRLPTVRDFAGSGAFIDRSFEIQQKSEDFASGNVRLELFGSTGRAQVSPPTTATNPLPDAYYTAQGVNLNTVCTIVPVGGVGVIQPGTYNLTGHTDANNSAAVYYYPGDLELADGATLTINNNVQLRVRGFFTVNGDIDGVGRGKAGVADSAGWMVTQAGTPGYIGNSRGMDGVLGQPHPRGGGNVRTQPCAFTQGQNAAFPFLELTVSGTSLLGLPGDMRGTSGGAGGKVGRAAVNDWNTGTVFANGGAGANSGAGLAIICRGLSVGASGSINTSGANPAATSSSANGTGFNWTVYPGAGGAGSPGGFLLLLDGAGISIPDLGGGRFIATCGTVPVNGTPLPQRGPAGVGTMRDAGWLEPGAGYLDEAFVSGSDLSNVAHRIQYVPATETATPDQESRPVAPTSISVSPGERINTVRVTPGAPLGADDFIEVYASINNNRANAVLFAFGKVTEFTHDLPSGGTRYYWSRVRRQVTGPDVFSDFLPASATGGIVATALDFVGEMPSRTGVFLDTSEHQDYARFYNLRAGAPTITYPTNGENGGRVLRVQNYGWFAWNRNVPYDPTQIYMMTVRVRMVTAPTGGLSGQDLIYAGVEGVAADGETLINEAGSNSFGSQHYFVASAFDMSSLTLGDWVTLRGYLSGHGATPGSAAHPNITSPMPAYGSGGTIVRFIRPLVILNYNGGNGTMEVDFVRLDRVVFSDGIGPNAATEIRTTSDVGPISSGSQTNTGVDIKSQSFTAVYDGQLISTLTFDAQKTAGGGTLQAGISAIDAVTTGGLPTAGGAGVIVTTTALPYVVRAISEVVAGQTAQVSLRSKHTSGSSTGSYSNIEIETEFVKK